MTQDCQHDEHSTTYHESGECETPYCNWSEYHCRKCGKYVQRCGCGYRNSESGWPESRWRKYWRKKDLDRNAKG